MSGFSTVAQSVAKRYGFREPMGDSGPGVGKSRDETMMPTPLDDCGLRGRMNDDERWGTHVFVNLY